MPNKDEFLESPQAQDFRAKHDADPRYFKFTPEARVITSFNEEEIAAADALPKAAEGAKE